MALKTYIFGILVTLVQLFLGLLFSIFAVSAGLTLLNRLTKEADEWALIKKGNAAVGILYAMVTIGLVIMLEPVITSTVVSAGTALLEGAWLSFVLHFLAFVLAFLIAVLSIYTTLRVTDTLTSDVSEFGEIAKGNVAMSLITGSMVIAVSFAIRTAITLVLLSLVAIAI